MRSLLVISLCMVGACASTPQKEGYSKVISPVQSGAPTSWDETELQSALAIRSLRRTPEASFHLARIKTELTRRMHEQSDLLLVVVSGKLELSLGDETVRVSAGDVVEIPAWDSLCRAQQQPRGRSAVRSLHARPGPRGHAPDARGNPRKLMEMEPLAAVSCQRRGC